MENISGTEIKTQVSKILSIPAFRRSEKLTSFLTYIIDERLKGNGSNLKAYSIGVSVFNRSWKFDARADNIVRVYGGKLRRELKNYYENKGIDDDIIISVPKGGYVPVIHPRGSEPESLQISDPVNSESSTRKDAPDISIAVIMFDLLNRKEDYGYVATGLTSEIIIALTKFSPLRVIGPFMQEEGKTFDFKSVHNDYDADFVLQGWVKFQNGSIKITTALSEAATSTKIWGEVFKYDFDTDTLGLIEEEVTSRIVGVIADGLGVIFRKLSKESYNRHIKINNVTNAVLAYNHAWIMQAPDDWIKAHQTVEKALSSHPDSALLLALKSNIYYGDILYELGLAPDSASEMLPLANKAVAMDPILQLAQYNLVVQHAYRGNAEKCVNQARKVVAMNPNHARILAGCAVATASVGHYDYALELIEKAKQFNPHYPGWYQFISYVKNFSEGNFDEAWTDAQQIHVEGLYLHPLLRASILGKLGMVKEAEPYIEELLHLKPDFIERYAEYIKPLLVLDKHVDMMWDGLKKAGIEEMVVESS